MRGDLTLYESGNGGDLILSDNDIDQTSSLWNNIYIALFGGNSVFEDSDEASAGENQRFDYWQNDIFFKNSEDQKILSETETFLSKMVITTKALSDLVSVVKSDLRYLGRLGSVSVQVTAESYSRIAIFVYIKENNSSQSKEFKFIWDSTKSEVILDRTL